MRTLRETHNGCGGDVRHELEFLAPGGPGKARQANFVTTGGTNFVTTGGTLHFDVYLHGLYSGRDREVRQPVEQ